MSKKNLQPLQKIASLVNACFGTFMLLWVSTSCYYSKVQKLIGELISSNDSLWHYSSSMIRTGIITESGYYKIFNWGFPLLVLLGVLLLVLMYTVSRQAKASASAEETVEAVITSNNDAKV